MMAYLEGLNTDNTSARSLTQLTALLGTGQRIGKSKGSRQLEGIKTLLVQARTW
jgi:hypothetical protein